MYLEFATRFVLRYLLPVTAVKTTQLSTVG